MNTNTMRYVIAVAEEGNFTRAAQRLYISQPSLSQNIHALEKQLGTPLFERNTTPIRLTYAGEVYVDWARKVVESEKQTVKRIDDISKNRKRKLIVGVSPYRSLHILPDVLTRFYEETEGACSVTLVEQRSSEYMKLMEEGKLDILIDRPSGDISDYETVPLMEERIFLAVPDCHGLDACYLVPGEEGVLTGGVFSPEDLRGRTEGRETTEIIYETVRAEALKDRPVILLSERQHMGRMWRSVFDAIHETPRTVLECQSIEMAYRMARRGLGLTMVSELVIRYLPPAPRLKYYVLKDFQMSRTMAVIYPRGKYLSEDARTFIRLLQDFLA